MRSFSSACGLLQRSKKTELAFLLQQTSRNTLNAEAEPPDSQAEEFSSTLNTRTAKQADLAFVRQAYGSSAHADSPVAASSRPPSLLNSRNEKLGHELGAAREPSGMPPTKAMKLLMNAVKHRNFSFAERLFVLSPRLSERPAAMRLLMKMYCEQLDFTTAKAVLLASLDKVGETGVARYVAHATFQSQNADDIEDVLKRSARHFGQVSPLLAATALYGLRFLNSSSFDRCWQLVSEFWEPSLRAATLRAKVLDALLDENWTQAAKLWKIAQGIARPEDSGLERRIWYMALRYFLAESPSLEAVDRVLSLMHETDIDLTPVFTELLLRYLAPMFPNMTPSAWLDYARGRGWPIDSAAAGAVITYSQGGLQKFGSVAHEILRYAYTKLPKLGSSRQTGALQLRAPPNGSLFLSEQDEERMQSREEDVDAQNDGESSVRSAHRLLSGLRQQLKQGVRIQYAQFVAAFERLTKYQAHNELRELIELIKAHGYPLHCAGIDLSMIELHCRESHFDENTTKQLLSEYLTQYPLVTHDLTQLTRIGVLLTSSGSHSEAVSVVDSLRQSAEGQAPGRYTNAVHDSASLQVICAAKFRLNEPLAQFLRGVVADEPNIYFDRLFLRKLRRMLMQRNEDLDVLTALDRSNEQTLARCYREIDTVAELVAQTK